MTTLKYDPNNGTDEDSMETPTATDDKQKGGSMGEEDYTQDSDLGSEETGEDQ